jgi:hypothetical protein
LLLAEEDSSFVDWLMSSPTFFLSFSATPHLLSAKISEPSACDEIADIHNM